MKPQWSIFSLCLLCAASGILGQVVNPRSTRARPAVLLPKNFQLDAIREAFSTATSSITARRGAASNRRPSDASRLIPNSPHQLFQLATPRSRNLTSVQETFEEATRILLKKFNLSPEQIKFALAQIDLKSVLEGNMVQECESQFNHFTFGDCRPTDKYRRFDGACNNLRHPSWGMAGSCYERLVDPDYADGVAEKRVAVSGNPLPAPRRVSLEIHADFYNPTVHVTHMFMQWGQVVSHDVNLTPQSMRGDGKSLQCCPVSAEDSPHCDPILLEPNDPFFRQFNITCLNNARSAMCSTCALGPRQQIDQVTSYLDASIVYGLNTKQANSLRNNDGTGTMRSVFYPEAGELLPKSSKPADDQCSFQDPYLDCFEAGDQRVNQHLSLTSFQTLLMREHNRLARRLREINPGWDEETLFQEARRILAAEMQMITYSEYLPLVLGPEPMEWLDLSVRRGNQYTKYNATVQGTLVNEFAVAAFRFGHSMVNSFFRNTRGFSNGNYLRDLFSYPFGLYWGELDGFVEGLAQSPAQKFDRYIVHDLTDHLYQFRGNQSGSDLASLNINRGRDHGIPGYTTYVKFCGGPQIRTWKDLDRVFQRGLWTRFERLYERVEDIDLFSGGLAERPNQGAIVGPTFACILGIQFYHMKFGDRFYYEHGGQTGSFTPAQLREIKKVTLGKLICDNSQISEISKNVFLFSGNRNPVELCSNKPGINLELWRE